MGAQSAAESGGQPHGLLPKVKSNFMAKLFPFSSRTEQLLNAMPEPGGTHEWLPKVAGGLKNLIPRERCFDFLRKCCDQFVTHRRVSDREIRDAVELAYSGTGGTGAIRKVNPNWPDPEPALISKVCNTYPGRFDGTTSAGIGASDALLHLFQPGDLICSGNNLYEARIRSREESLADAALHQFLVPNPMRGKVALNEKGLPSPRCKANVRVRRYLVVEFDNEDCKRRQAQLASALADIAPLVMAVDSGNKSIHAWYRVGGMTRRDQVRFFMTAALLGADTTRWDPSGWVRMPGGIRSGERTPEVSQVILHFDMEGTGIE